MTTQLDSIVSTHQSFSSRKITIRTWRSRSISIYWQSIIIGVIAPLTDSKYSQYLSFCSRC